MTPVQQPESPWNWLRRKLYRARLPDNMRHMRKVHPDFRLAGAHGILDTVYWRGKPVGRILPLERLTRAAEPSRGELSHSLPTRPRCSQRAGQFKLTFLTSVTISSCCYPRTAGIFSAADYFGNGDPPSLGSGGGSSTALRISSQSSRNQRRRLLVRVRWACFSVNSMMISTHRGSSGPFKVICLERSVVQFNPTPISLDFQS
jgi:hypothetical protein